MAEGTYDYECMRAELLGVGKPDYEEFMQRKREGEENRRLAAEVEEEAIEAANLQEVEAEGEALKATGGKLDELNSILSATQKKLDRFKVRCGSVTELIKTKIGSINSPNAFEVAAAVSLAASDSDDVGALVGAQTELAEEVAERKPESNHTSGLDALLNKTERAQLAMNNQNKQIKTLLK